MTGVLKRKHRRNKMAEFKVTVKGESGSISYNVYKTEKAAKAFGIKVAGEAFYGEACEIEVVAL